MQAETREKPHSHHIWRPVKQKAADNYLLTLIAVYGATVVLVRAYLELTGYPQIGDSTFHIAHLLWGGALMFAAIVILLIWANPWRLQLAAVLGGIGAGLFIDEVGKFITQKNDYFFPLAFPIIYSVSLIGVWLYFRVRRTVPRDSRTLLYHTLHDLKHVLDMDLDEFELRELIDTLGRAIAAAKDPAQRELARALLAYVQSRDVTITQQLSWSERLVMNGREWVGKHPPRRVLKTMLIASLLLVAFLAGGKLLGLLIAVQAPDMTLVTVLSNYVIVNGKSRYEVHNAVLISLHTLLVVVTGLMALASVLLLLIGRERRGLRIGVLGMVLALTAVNLLTFYFNQLYTMIDALTQLNVVILAQLYRWRFFPTHEEGAPEPAVIQAGTAPAGPGG